MQLTDEDRANISTSVEWDNDSTMDYVIEQAYLAGLRAGMERAAKICNAIGDSDLDAIAGIENKTSNDAMRFLWRGNRCTDCADAIRAAIAS